jgi:diacylglycerol kinase (ATP)
MENLVNSLRKTRKSFKYAFKGIDYLLRHENNFRFHMLAAVFTIALGLSVGLTTSEWLVIIIMIGLVLMAEASNTALEKFLDVLHPEIHPTVAIAKDLAAGAVLLISITAAVVGLIIFGSRLV